MRNSITSVARIIVPAFALSLALASAAGAQDIYGACSKNKNGVEKVRPGSIVVNQSPSCKITESPRSWNEEGPQGPPGVIGSCHVEEFPGTNLANTFSVLNASCSSGKATSSAAIWHTPFDAADNGPFYFFPRSDTMHTVIPWNHTASTQDYRFFLVCCQ